MKKPQFNGVFAVPHEVSRVTERLKMAGFKAYLVGGCVRDLLLGRKPRDWDVTTNAEPKEIASIFENTFYENEYGTVGVVNDTGDETLKVVEVTPHRIEDVYSDSRRPDSVMFSDKLEDDLKRRDFTINAIALAIEAGAGGISKGELLDPHGGETDLSHKLIRTVGNPEERFSEDGLRPLRALRLATELGFDIETETLTAIKKTAKILTKISKERVRDEFEKIIASDKPMRGLILLKETGLMTYVVPYLAKGIDVKQNKAHAYDVFEHTLRTVQHSADRGFPIEVRLSALFHDIAKPDTRRWSEEKRDWTFYGHDVVGARIATKALSAMHFPTRTIEKVAKLVRWHMFFSDTEKITHSAVRRVVSKVGKENIWDLMNLRVADRIGTGRPKENPYRLRKYKAMIEEVLRQPISVGMLAINGSRVMELTGLPPGPKIGYILHALLEEVLDEPDRNTKEYLEKRTMELSVISDDELSAIGEKAKHSKERAEDRELEKIRREYRVK